MSPFVMVCPIRKWNNYICELGYVVECGVQRKVFCCERTHDKATWLYFLSNPYALTLMTQKVGNYFIFSYILLLHYYYYC